MAGLADPQQLEIDSSGRPDPGLIAGALGLDLAPWGGAGRQVDVGSVDVDVVEQVLPHEPVVGVDTVRRHRVILVKIERHHPGKRQALLPMEPDQLAVDADRGRAGGQAEHGVATLGVGLTDDRRDGGRHLAGEGFVVVADDGADSFHRTYSFPQHREVQGARSCSD